MSKELSNQAKNSINLYKGNPPSMIKQLLKNQKISVVEELERHYDVDNIDELAIKLSRG